MSCHNVVSLCGRTYKSSFSHESKHYCRPRKDEISSPEDFNYSTWTTTDELSKQSSICLRTSKEDHEQGFPNLCTQFEIWRKLPPDRTPDVKGKSKMKDTLNDEFTHLREHWQHDYADIMNGTKEELSPWREVNHEINLIDSNKRYHYDLPCCPNSLRDQLHEKINWYVKAGWWEPRAVSQPAPMLCILKKNTKLCTVVNSQQQNENTVKDVTPLPDREIICEDVAWAKIRSKIDLSNAYEQVHI